MALTPRFFRLAFMCQAYLAAWISSGQPQLSIHRRQCSILRTGSCQPQMAGVLQKLKAWVKETTCEKLTCNALRLQRRRIWTPGNKGNHPYLTLGGLGLLRPQLLNGWPRQFQFQFQLQTALRLVV